MPLDAGPESSTDAHLSSSDSLRSDSTSAKKRRPRRRRSRGKKNNDNYSASESSQQKTVDNPTKQSNKVPEKRSFHGTAANKGVFSAIDLGTNNCRLLIAAPTRNGFRVVDAFSRVVRLGEGLSHNGRLSDEAMDRTIEALKICADKITRRRVTCMRHVATEACRIATNSDAFLERIKSETGLNLDIISAGEEAKLAVMGCQSLIAYGNRNALVFDIGGGSTELIWVKVRGDRSTEIIGWMSIPWGVVNLSEHFSVSSMGGSSVLPSDTYERMMTTVIQHLETFEAAHNISKSISRRHTQLLGTSGTVTTLASLHLRLPRYIRDKVDGAWMKAGDIKALSRSVASMSYDERVDLACIGSERADLVVAGCAILEAILSMWNVPSLRVADRGIREGILRGMMNIDTEPLAPRNRNKHRPWRKKRNKPKGQTDG